MPLRRIGLTGFMGSGKSTVGPLLAPKAGLELCGRGRRDRSRGRYAHRRLFLPVTAKRPPHTRTCNHRPSGRGRCSRCWPWAAERLSTRPPAILLLTAPGTLLVHLEVELATTLARCRGTEQSPGRAGGPGKPRQPLSAASSALSHRTRLNFRGRADTGTGR